MCFLTNKTNSSENSKSEILAAGDLLFFNTDEKKHIDLDKFFYLLHQY